jgi:hypothetical protein
VILKIIPYKDPWYNTICDHLKIEDPGWWYMDGKLETLCGTDKGTIYNLSEYPEILRDMYNPYPYPCPEQGETETIEWGQAMYLEGEVKVEILISGNPYSGIGCFWVNKLSYVGWKQRGLVVLEEDTESLKLARIKMRIGAERL